MKRTKYMPISKERFEKMFTEDEQNKIKETLKAFDEVFVVYEYGQYHYGTGACLKAEYAPDHEVIGTLYAEDIFTAEERIINYVESFHDYPIEYKGARNYRMLNEVERNWDAKFAFDENGTIVRVL